MFLSPLLLSPPKFQNSPNILMLRCSLMFLNIPSSQRFQNSQYTRWFLKYQISQNTQTSQNNPKSLKFHYNPCSRWYQMSLSSQCIPMLRLLIP